MEEKILNEWIKFDKDAGVSINTQSKIFEDLKLLLESSFGTDFVIQEGSEMFTFLDLLATSIAQSAGVYKNIYDSLGFINSSGVTLDNAVSLAGITREGLIRSYVDITITKEDSIGSTTIYSPIRIQDSNGNNWYSNEDILIENDTTSLIRRFYASDSNIEKPYNVFIKSFNGKGNEIEAKDWKITSVVPTGIKFQNKNDSVLGQEKESDAQLKYRYFTALYNSSTGTVDGLKSKLLNANNMNLSLIDATTLINPVHYVYIFQNNENILNEEYQVEPHSIWVIVDGKSSWEGSGESTTDKDDETIAKIIKNFKSLGVGTSSGISKELENGEGKIKYVYEEEGIKRTIYFSRAESLDCYINMTISWKDDIDEEEKSKIKSAINEAVINYVNSLGINNDVLFSGVIASIFNVYKNSGYEDYIFDITDLKIGNTASPSETRLPVKIYQYAKTDLTKVTIN